MALSKKKRGVRIIFYIVISFFILLLALMLIRECLALKIRNENKITTSNGIDSMEYVEINGIKQAIHIRGENMKNPIILFLHGGPGFTDMPVSYRYQTEWEQYFTVVQWDQRLAGKTYITNKHSGSSANDSIELRVSDCIELTKYLTSRFDTDKIVLMGHSWGTVLGIHTIKEAPELYSAYIGVSQLVNLVESESLGYEQTLKMAIEAGANKDIATLKSILPYPIDGTVSYFADFPSKMMTLRKLQGDYEIGMPASYAENIQFFVPSPYYSLWDLSYYFTDVFANNQNIYKWLYEEYDMRKMELSFDIPTIFIYGSNDWTTPPHLFKSDVFDSIQSPFKDLYILDHAAHRPMNDNPDMFNQILIDVVYPLCGAKP